MFSKIFITGGTGFLGSYIIKELIEKGYQVKAIRRSAKLPHWIDHAILEKVEWVEADVLDVVALEEAMQDTDAVIHAAAIVSFSPRDRKKMYQINVDGTANVVNIAIEKNVRRFIHISSVAAIGRTENSSTVNESKVWQESKTNTHYAKSKYKSELQVWRGMAEGLSAAILNPSTILGYGDWNSSSNAIFKNTYNEFKWYSTGINGFVDVEDVARLVVVFLENDITEQRYIVNGDNWEFRKLMNTMADGFGKKRPYKKISKPLVAIAWRLEKLTSFFTRKKPLLTKESGKVAMSRTQFDNSKIITALPDFHFTPLEQSIKRACGKYLKNLP